MLPEFAGYWECLQGLHAGIERTVKGLPLEALDWVRTDITHPSRCPALLFSTRA